MGRLNRVSSPYAKKIAQVKVAREPLNLAIGISPNRVYVNNGNRGVISVLSGGSNKLISTIRTGTAIGSMVYQEDKGRLLVTAAARALFVFKGSSNELLRRVPLPGEPGKILANSSSKRIYVALDDSSLLVLNGNTLKRIALIPIPEGIVDFAIDKTSNRIYAVGNRLTVINGASNSLAATIDIGLQPLVGAIAVDSSARRVYLSNFYGGADSAVFAIDTRTSSIINRIPVESVSGIAVHRRSHRIYAGSTQGSSGRIAVINGAADKVAKTVKTRRSTADIVGLDNRRGIVYLSSEADGYISFVDSSTNRLFKSIFVGASRLQPIGMILNPITGKLYVSNFKKNIVSVIRLGRL